MTKTKLILVVSFLLAFAAGTSMGLLLSKPHPKAHDQSRMAEELNLTSTQREEMSQIWEAMDPTFKQLGERRSAASGQRDKDMQSLLSDSQRSQVDTIKQDYSRKLDELRTAAAAQRDKDIQAILSEDQRGRYDSIQQDYARKTDEISQERKKTFDQAVARTRQILTADQIGKFDEWMKKRGDHGGSFRGSRNRYSTSASRPATQEQPTSGGVK